GTAPDWVDLYFGYSPLLVLLFFDVSSDEKARIEKALQGTGAFFDYDQPEKGDLSVSIILATKER
ncbi:MAG: hypothetical protein NZ532_03610, partial [Thermoflexales bacterium]|nr:hypothetical protein [Thermoflexales bacterium]